MILSLLFSGQPLLFIVIVAAIVYVITVHEFSHAFAGHLEGDHTAESMGRLTLNPFSHIEPWGFALLLVVGFGWGRPVPFNPLNLKHKRWGPALISLAGPISNILSLILFGSIYKILVVTQVIASTNFLMVFLEWLMILNAILAVFNLIPIPPLDGSKLLFAILPTTNNTLRARLFLERYGIFILIGLIFLDNVSPISILGGLFRLITDVVARVFG